MEESNRKYLKNKMKISPTLPSEPLIRISIKDNKTITVNKILLKKLSSASSLPNFVYAFFIFKESLVSLPVYTIITNALPVAIFTPLHIVFYKLNPNNYLFSICIAPKNL